MQNDAGAQLLAKKSSTQFHQKLGNIEIPAPFAKKSGKNVGEIDPCFLSSSVSLSYLCSGTYDSGISTQPKKLILEITGSSFQEY